MHIGIDIEQVSRIERALTRTPRFAWRLFSEAERAYCESKPHPAQHFAARFCAKEAFIKAMGRAFPWRDVEIVHGAHGAPALRVTGAAAEALAGRTVQVSLSHAGDYATAVVLIED